MASGSLDTWLAALEERHLANLTRSELTRALRALSSCYVERRDKLSAGAPLESAGKRAAFALFYGPLHFLTIGAIVRALGANQRKLDTIHDLGCGTGVGGAAWALACERAAQGSRHRSKRLGGRRSQLELQGAWRHMDGPEPATSSKNRAICRVGRAEERAESPILLAYAVNELPDAGRAELLLALTDVAKQRRLVSHRRAHRQA